MSYRKELQAEGQLWGCRVEGQPWRCRVEGQSWGCKVEGQPWGCRVEGHPVKSRLEVSSFEKADAQAVKWQGRRNQDKDTGMMQGLAV